MTDLLDRLTPYVAMYLRLALGITFLAAVADRFGLWGPPGATNVAWGDFQPFLDYTATLNPYLPASVIPPLGWIVTVAETTLGVALIAGFRTQITALLSGFLLLAFAIDMTIGLGFKAPLNYSVFSASAGALLLGLHPSSAIRHHDHEY